jgi:ADP-ribosyl-[dinitrogen reductase] hydrolase
MCKAAGVGKATLQATFKLWLGSSPRSSGVFSAGNGPAMRSAVLGAAVADRDSLRSLVGVSTRITHTDPKAEYGAWAVALAARLARGGVVSPSAYLEELRLTSPPEAAELLTRMERCVRSATAGESTEAFAEAEGLGKGVSGYVYHTVPVALHAWLSHQHDFRAGVEAVVRCGGDTDTTAAIAGGVIGAGVGKEGIPAAWRDGLFEWPRTVAWMEALGERLADGGPAPRLSAGVVGRNALFFLIVLGHVARRCLPPY